MSWPKRILELLGTNPGGMTHGELRGALPGLSDGVLRLQLHQLRKQGMLRPSVSRRDGRAPLAQRSDDTNPPRKLVALRGAAALLVRRVLVGDVLEGDDAVQHLLRTAQHDTTAAEVLHTLRARGVVAPDWPLRLGEAAFSFED